MLHAPAAVPSAPATPEDLDALFAEARRRRRRRRRRQLVAVAIAAAAASAVGLLAAGGPGAPAGGAAPRQAAGGLPVGALVTPERPESLAAGPGGRLYLADPAREQILEWVGHGRFRVVAGTGRAGFAGDGGPALGARLDAPGGMTVAPDGTLLLADGANNRIRAISPAGTITTIVGDGRGGWTAGGAPATRSPLPDPTDVARARDGRVYITAGNEVLRIDRDGRLAIIAANREFGGAVGIGGPARVASPDNPNAIAFDRDGDLYIAGFATKALLMITPGGRMTAPIGAGPDSGFYPRGDGGLVTTPSGAVLAIDTLSIERLSPHAIQVLYSFGTNRTPRNFEPNGIAPDGRGGVYVDTDGVNGVAPAAALLDVHADGRLTVLWSAAHSPRRALR